MSEIQVLVLILRLYRCKNKIFKYKLSKFLSEPLHALKIHLLIISIYILFIKVSKMWCTIYWLINCISYYWIKYIFLVDICLHLSKSNDRGSCWLAYALLKYNVVLIWNKSQKNSNPEKKSCS